ncbi:MAG: hypothetical protein ABI885_18165 [Gammaproteobacteria bacterium]
MSRLLPGLCLLMLIPMTASARPVLEAERAQAEASCRAESPSTDLFSCACVGKHVAESAAAADQPANYQRLAYKAFDACPQDDKAVLENKAFKSCDSVQQNLRTDHVQYCHCVGEDVAREFLAAPAIGVKQFQMLIRNGYLKCGVDKEATRIKDMKAPVATGGAAFEKVRAEQQSQCRDNGVTAAWYDCACFGRKMAEDAAAAGESRPVLAQKEAYEACPQDDKAPIESSVFASCDSYMVSVRKDHEAVCRCTAQKTAAAFLAKPMNNLRYREQLRRDAMDQCAAAAGPAQRP